MQREPNKMWFHIAWHKILRLLASKVNRKKHSALSSQPSAKELEPTTILRCRGKSEKLRARENFLDPTISAWAISNLDF